MTKNNLITTIVIVVVVGALGFYGGMQYQKGQGQGRNFSGGANQGFPNGTNQTRKTGEEGRAMGSRPISGEITSLDEGSITIKTEDGSSKIVIYSTSTKVNQTSEASASDLKVGGQITAIGSEDSQGTVTAQSISIGGAMFQGMPGGNRPGQNEQQPF